MITFEEKVEETIKEVLILTKEDNREGDSLRPEDTTEILCENVKSKCHDLGYDHIREHRPTVK